MPSFMTSRVRTACFLLWCLSWPIIAIILLKPLPFAFPSRTDLLGHFLLFGTLSGFVVLFARSQLQILSLAAITIVLSIALEVGQAFVPNRFFDLADVAANIAGGIGGCLLALLIFRAWTSPGGRTDRIPI